MKSTFILIITLFLSIVTTAQNGFNYKALVKDTNGNVISNQLITVQFQILENGTNNIYQETHKPTTNANGIINVNIGEGDSDSGNFSTIDWGVNDHFLNVQIESGNGFVDLGTTQFKSVPYAQFSEDTRKGTLNDAYNKGGNGAGRIIDATNGKVEITGDGLEIKNALNETALSVDGATNTVGIGTDNPQGALDISGSNNMGAIMPRVADLSMVTDGNGNPPVDGTMVFDTSKRKLCVYINGDWACFGFNEDGTTGGSNANQNSFVGAETTKLTDSNQNTDGLLGWDTEISEDGNVLAVSKPLILNNSIGAVVIFEKQNGSWVETATIVNNGVNVLHYGTDIDLNETGDKLVIGGRGYVYYYEKINGTWTEQEIIEVTNGVSERFGLAVTLSDDGNTLGVSAIIKNSNKGAIYIFNHNGTNWVETTQLEPSGPSSNNALFFGWNIALSGDGNTIVTGMPIESSASTGINNYQPGTNLTRAGAVYVYKLINNIWTFDAYIKPHRIRSQDFFGAGLSVSGDGTRIAVGAYGEDSLDTGITNATPFPENDAQQSSGAVYIFDYTNGNWEQTAFIKSDKNDPSDYFGMSVALSHDGNILVASAPLEDSDFAGVFNEASVLNESINKGALFVYENRQGNWNLISFIKAEPGTPFTELNLGSTFWREDYNGVGWFNDGTPISIDASGKIIAVGAPLDSSPSSILRTGSVFVFEDVD